MKTFAQLLHLTCLLMLGGLLVLACKKRDEPTKSINPGPGKPTDTTKVEDVNKLADQLQLPRAIKKPGNVPEAPAGGSSLKISIKDTLYLIQGMLRPIRFLHQDTTKNVAGAYVQVHVAVTGGPLDATYYYDVPEIKEAAESDTVSIVLAGFDPTNLSLPLTFTVTITPYDAGGQPLDETKVPVRVEELNDDAKKSGTCGLVLPEGDFWDWNLSYRSTGSGQEEFMSSPDIVFGAEGQDIKGSCCNGSSLYGVCPGAKITNASLHFSTYYQIRSETFTFFDNGTFLRQTFESSANPLPRESDFCGKAPGVVQESLSHVVYKGNWTVDKATLPPDLQAYRNHDRNHLTMQTTSSTGGGYGNGGGIIHQLDCRTGDLVLIQVNPEGFGHHLYKFYSRVSPGESPWYPF